MNEPSGTIQMAYETVKQSNAVPPYILALIAAIWAVMGPTQQLDSIGAQVATVGVKLARIEASIHATEERSREAIDRVALLEVSLREMQVSSAQASGEISGWRQQTAGDLAALRVRIGKIEDRQEK